MSPPSALSRFASFFLEALFPRSCYGCNKTDTYLCRACRASIALPQPLCPHCGTRLPFGLLSPPCRRATRLDRLFCCGAYKTEPMRAIIGDFKYNQAYALATPLASFMAQWLAKNGYAPMFARDDILLLPVPSHPKRMRQRGFNPAQRLAAALASELSLPLDSATLKKRRNNPQQMSLQREKRATNVEGAFSLPHPEAARGKVVVLVDDVLTTGATLRECAKAVRAARPKEVWALVLAKD